MANRKEKLTEEMEILTRKLKIAEERGHKVLEGKLYAGLGQWYGETRNYKKGIEHHRAHLKVAELTRDAEGKGDAHRNLGNCLRSTSKYQKAIEHYEMYLEIAKETGDKAGEGSAIGNLGNCYISLGQYQKAIEHCEMRLKIAKEIGDKAGEGSAIGNLGICYRCLGQYQKAIENYEMHLKIAKEIGDKAGEGSAIGNLGICYRCLGQYQKAIEHCQMHMKIAKEIGAKAAEGSAIGNLGICYHCLGQYQKAIEHYEMRLKIAKEIGDKAGEGSAIGNLGTCYYPLGQYQTAIEHYQMHLKIAKEIGDKAGEGSGIGNLGNCYNSLGQYQKAIEHFEMHLKIAKEIGDKAGEGSAIGNLGICYSSLGQYQTAIEHYEMRLKIAKEIGDKAGERSAIGNLGICYSRLGQYRTAIEHCEMHLKIAKEIGDKAGEGSAIGNLGICYRRLGQYQKAIEHYEMHLKIAKETGDKAGEGLAIGNLGNCYHGLGQYQKAVEYHQLALTVAKKVGDIKREALVLRNLGAGLEKLRLFEKSEKCYRESVDSFEELFQNAPIRDRFKVSILDTFISTYRSLVGILLLQGKHMEGLVIADRVRSKALLELLKRVGHSWQCFPVPKTKPLDQDEILDVAKALNNSVLFISLVRHVICAWVIPPDGKELTFVPQDVVSRLSDPPVAQTTLKSMEDKVGRLLNQMTPGTKRCEDRSLSFLYPADSSQVSSCADRTEVCGSEKPNPDHVHSADTKREAHPSLAPLVGSKASSDINRDDTNVEFPGIVGLLKDLFQTILHPVQQFVHGSQVTVVPDGEVALVPFAALIDGDGRYVAESLQVRLVPSLATAKMIMERADEPHTVESRPLIVGDPDVGEVLDGEEIVPVPRLPFARNEVGMIGKLLGVEPFTADTATKESFLENAESANLIHIAAHGDVERGEILLAPNSGKAVNKLEDVLLAISDLEEKRLRAKLVVLSCCHSGQGDVRAEGIVGIGRAFLGAGARAVLVSLWAVNDEATMYFMKSFYEHLICGETASEALSQAMRAMKETEEYSHPRHWGGFVLIGVNVAPFGEWAACRCW